MATLTIKEPDKEPRVLTLGAEPLIIGRSQTRCNLTFDFLGLSAKHCQIVQAGETFKLVDLDSANHTFVNGREIVEHYLNHGDRIALGVIILTYNDENQKQPPPRAGAQRRSSSRSPAIQTSDPVSNTFKDPTFIMEGKKLQEKMELLRSGKLDSIKDDMPGEERSLAARSPSGGTAKEYARAAEAGTAKVPRDMRWLFFALGFFLALALCVALGIFFMIFKF